MSKYFLAVGLLFLCACSLEELPEETTHLMVEARLSVDRNTCTAPCRINFKSESINADTYFWEFGDGNTSSSMSTTNAYLNPGEYEVTLTASNLLGEHSLTQVITVLNGSTFHLEDVSGLGRISDLELLEDGSLMIAGENQIVKINKEGQIMNNRITEGEVVIMEINHQNNGLLTLSDFRVYENCPSSAAIAQFINFSGEAISESTYACKFRTNTDMVKIGDNQYAAIGELQGQGQSTCNFCPTKADDLIIVKEDGTTLTDANFLENGKITTAFTIDYFSDDIVIGGGVKTCLDEACKNSRYDFAITFYDDVTLQLKNDLLIDNQEQNINVVSDLVIDDQEHLYVIGQSSSRGEPFEECGGSVFKIDENGNILWEETAFKENCILPLSIDIFKDEILITGISNQLSEDNSSQIILIKLSKEGEYLFPNQFATFEMADPAVVTGPAGPQGPGGATGPAGSGGATGSSKDAILAKGVFDTNGQIILFVNSTKANLYRLNPDGTL